jgi:hypothetical protein
MTETVEKIKEVKVPKAIPVILSIILLERYSTTGTSGKLFQVFG